MEKLIKIALLAFAEQKLAQRSSARSPLAAVCIVFGFFTGLATIACGVAALWIFLAVRIGEAGAALWSAILLLFITIILLVTARLMMNGSPARNAPPIFEDIAGELKRGMGDNKLGVLIASLVAGLALGGLSRK